MTPTSSTIRTVHVRIEGRVQGVGYRYWTQTTALRLGLGGWVRNRRDASVEAVFSGEASAVEDMLARCRSGPRLSSAVTVTILPAGLPAGIEVDGDSISGFEIRATL